MSNVDRRRRPDSSSSVSEASLDTLKYLKSIQLPVNVVRLDNPRAREVAMNGPHFQVTEVPTLVVLFQEGNLKMFVGAPKVLKCLQMLHQQSSQPQQEEEPPLPPQASRVIEHDDSPVEIVEEEPEMIEEDDTPPPPKRVPKKAAKVKETTKTKSQKPPKTSTTKVVKTAKAKKSKIRKAASEDEELEIDFVDPGEDEQPQGRRPPPSNGGNGGLGPTNGKGSQMRSIMEQARAMEKQFKAQRGYDEKDLPYPSI